MTPPKKDKTVAVEATLADAQPVSKVAELSLAQAATHVEDEESRRSKGQRWTSVLWETTQALIALLVLSTAMYVSAILALHATRSDAKEADNAAGITAFPLISNATFVVIGFYYGRSNHQRVGGVGGDSVGHTR